MALVPAGYTRCFRADSRTPAELLTGFQLWVPLTVEQSRDYLMLHAGKTLTDFPELAAMVARGTLEVQKDVSEGGTCTPQDLMRYIINEKSRRRPTVSTDMDDTCGGYQGYIYTIHAPVYEVAWNDAIPNLARPGGFWPKLYLNAPTLAQATKIAVRNKQGVQEVTFLTPIPRDEIALCTYNGAQVYP